MRQIRHREIEGESVAGWVITSVNSPADATYSHGGGSADSLERIRWNWHVNVTHNSAWHSVRNDSFLLFCEGGWWECAEKYSGKDER